MRIDYIHSGVVLMLAGALAGVLSVTDGQLKSRETSARNTLLVVAYLDPAVSDAAGSTLADTLKRQDPAILESRYQSKEEALKIAQANPAWAKALMLMKGNPLPSTVSIRYADTAWVERSDPAQFLKESPEIAEVRWDVQLRDAFRYYKVWRQRIVWGYVGLFPVLLVWGIILLSQKRGLRRQGISG